VLCRGLEKNGKVRAGIGRGMTSVNQTRPSMDWIELDGKIVQWSDLEDTILSTTGHF
jgi:hypothetical protein